MWQQALELVEAVYAVTSSFPIAEHCGTSGAIWEERLDTLVPQATRLGYASDFESLREILDEVTRLVLGLAASLRPRSA